MQGCPASDSSGQRLYSVLSSTFHPIPYSGYFPRHPINRHGPLLPLFSHGGGGGGGHSPLRERAPPKFRALSHRGILPAFIELSLTTPASTLIPPHPAFFKLFITRLSLLTLFLRRLILHGKQQADLSWASNCDTATVKGHRYRYRHRYRERSRFGTYLGGQTLDSLARGQDAAGRASGTRQ